MLRLLRALLAGGAATLVDLAVLTMLVELFAQVPRAANVPALVAGGIVQFVANRRFVFGARGEPIVRQVIAFVVVESLALLFNGFLYDHAMRAFSPHLFVLVRLVTSNVVFLFWSYPMWHFVFQRREPSNAR
jgi:putative flippase GtrA